MLKEPCRIGPALVAAVHGNGAQKGIHRLRDARRLSRCQFWQRLLRQRLDVYKRQSIEEVGGGICQVSSTLFNAVARANLEIVSRSPHAWPSTYVNIGEDATVNWPNLDLSLIHI